MTDNTTLPDDVLAQIRSHDETPTITDTDDLLYHDDRAYIVHWPGEVTRIGIHHATDGTPRVTGIVRITTNRPPRITPADDVLTVGRITHIYHGPGRETRVLS